MRKSVLAVLVFITILIDANAQEMPDKEEMDKAMKECFDSVSKDDQGRPDRDAVDQCLEDKGFTKPEGMPEKGDGQNPPPHR